MCLVESYGDYDTHIHLDGVHEPWRTARAVAISISRPKYDPTSALADRPPRPRSRTERTAAGTRVAYPSSPSMHLLSIMPTASISVSVRTARAPHFAVGAASPSVRWSLGQEPRAPRRGPRLYGSVYQEFAPTRKARRWDVRTGSLCSIGSMARDLRLRAL